MEFHEKLQELRKQRGMTQEELATALYVSRTAVSKLESGRGYPSIDSLKAISGFFGVPDRRAAHRPQRLPGGLWGNEPLVPSADRGTYGSVYGNGLAGAGAGLLCAWLRASGTGTADPPPEPSANTSTPSSNAQIFFISYTPCSGAVL